MTTGGPGTVHNGGDPIPSVDSDRLCSSPAVLHEEAMQWHWLIVLASLLGCVDCGSVISQQGQSLADPELS